MILCYVEPFSNLILIHNIITSAELLHRISIIKIFVLFQQDN